MRRVRELVSILAIVGTLIGGESDANLGSRLSAGGSSPNGHRWTGGLPNGPHRRVSATHAPDGHRWERPL